MSAFEQWLDKAATRGPDRVIPSSAAIAVTKDGIIYSHSAGTQSEDPASPLFDKPLSPDNSIWIASATKLMTSISILQLFEKGLVDLDADVSSVLPEFANPDVFIKFNDAGEPTYEKAIKKITIRMLLTHQSGMGYNFFHPYIQQIRDFKEKAGDAVPSKLTWVHTCKPTSGTPSPCPPSPSPPPTTTLASSLDDATLRGPDNTFLPAPNHFYHEGAEFESGGAGLFASPSAYGKLLAAILRDDGTLLRPETMAMLFEPQLSPEVQPYFDAAVYAEGAEVLSQSLPREARLTQALGGA
ncbi:hypothetical protein VE04_07794, partial [Pseudogymnoascus sp. 24MN13]